MPTKKEISLLIDDVPIEVEAGTTIMEAAEQSRIRIPRLCYDPDLTYGD
jgi:NADH dehydrogenase/NADH:ubiquinone oxidoreductase subunit G